MTRTLFARPRKPLHQIQPSNAHRPARSASMAFSSMAVSALAAAMMAGIGGIAPARAQLDESPTLNRDTGRPNWSAACADYMCISSANDGWLRIELSWTPEGAHYVLTPLACDSGLGPVEGQTSGKWLQPIGSNYKTAARKLSYDLARLQRKKLGSCGKAYRRPLEIYSVSRLSILLSTTGPQILGGQQTPGKLETPGRMLPPGGGV